MPNLRRSAPVWVELFGFLEVGLLDLTIPRSLLQAEQGIEIYPSRFQMFLFRLSQ